MNYSADTCPCVLVFCTPYVLMDTTLHLRTTLSPENIYDLLKLCLTTTCFQWREKFYEQTHGAPMGSPLSPFMANLFMEEFEKKALATSTLKQGFWHMV